MVQWESGDDGVVAWSPRALSPVKGKGVKALRVGPLFICGSGHSKTNHVAGTMREMRALSKLFGCSGWRSVDGNVEKADDLVHLLTNTPQP